MAQVGKPPYFESPEQLQEAIDRYYQSGESITITGMAYFLGFESRQSFYDYEKRPEYSYVIKRARLKVESKYEDNLSSQYVAGSIFALKNMGWKDKTEHGFTDGDGNDVKPFTLMLDSGCKEIEK